MNSMEAIDSLRPRPHLLQHAERVLSEVSESQICKDSIQHGSALSLRQVYEIARGL